MKSHRLLPLGILALAVMSLCLVVPARAAEGHFARTLQVSGAVELEVQTGSGTIDVRTGDSSSVRVTATIRANGGWFDSASAEKRSTTWKLTRPSNSMAISSKSATLKTLI